MKSFGSVLITVIIILLAGCNPYSEKIKKAEEYILQLKQQGNTAGLAVTVSIDSAIVYSKGFGMANLEQLIQASPSKTKFRIGSTSKALTSAALGILLNQGKLDLDKEIQEYVPYFPKKRWTITVRQVAGHIAGIRHYNGPEFLSAKRYQSVNEGLGIFMNDSLLFQPGQEWRYSSYGWNVISAVIEGVSGDNYLDYMDENIFKPLGMNNTIADMTDSIIINRAGFYESDSARILNSPYVDNSYKWAGGGFISTTEDIVRFGNAILYNKLFPPEIKVQLITSQVTNDGKETGYGVGWFTGVNEFGREFYGHSGGSIGGCGNLIIYPIEKLVIAYFTNDSTSPVGDEIHELAEIFMKHDENE